ncbi:MAG: metallophosphoesterase [Elusimicrobia bacterium]|nr:metallophosphoesterase [Elusimicrobiota bacterium]
MLAALLACLATTFAHSASLIRGPYVEGVTRSSGWICWRTDVPAEGSLEWRPKAGGQARLENDAEPKRQRCLEASGLAAGALVEYRVRLRQRGGPAVWSSTHSFRAASGPGAAARFAVFGDSGRGTPEQFAVARMAVEANPEFVLHTGDVVYSDGADVSYDKKYFAPYAALLDRVPFYFGIGNHDYDAGGVKDAAKGREWLRDNWFAVHHNPSGTPPRRTFYSFDWGPGHFVSVDTNQGIGAAAAPALDPGCEQWNWLDRDLAASTAPWKIVFLHIPPYSSGWHGANAHLQRTLVKLLEERGVDVVFQGHDHDYERTKPILRGAPAKTGPVYVTVGTGGAPLYDKEKESEWTEVFLKVFGLLEVTLEPGSLKGRGVGIDGKVFDEFELRKPR